MFLINFFEHKANDIKVGYILKWDIKLYAIFVVPMTDTYFSEELVLTKY